MLWYEGPTQTTTKYITCYWYKDVLNEVNTYSGTPLTTIGEYSFTGSYDVVAPDRNKLSAKDYLLRKRTFEQFTPDDLLPAFRAYLNVKNAEVPDSPIIISVGGKTLSRFIELDEDAVNDLIATEEPEDIHVKLTLNAGEWSTIALPFYMNSEQLRETFGSNVQLAEFVKYETDADVSFISVIFKETNIDEDGLTPLIPYIIKTGKNVSEFYVTTKVQPWGGFAHFNDEDPLSGEELYGYFVGTYCKSVIPWNCLYLSNNTFHYASEDTELKAFHAFFDFKDKLKSPEQSSSLITMNIGNITTGIILATNDNAKGEMLYDLQGRRVTIPKKGIYIKKGKKMWVK